MPTDDRSEPLCGEPHPSLLTADDGPARCARSRGHSGDHGTVEGTRWPSPDPVSEVREECTHSDERGSTVMQATDDRYECIVCGQRFRLVPLTPAGPEERGEGLRAAVLQAGTGDGVRTNCPLTGVHEHTFRGPHVFDEWYAATSAPDTGAEERLRAAQVAYLRRYEGPDGSGEPTILFAGCAEDLLDGLALLSGVSVDEEARP